MTRIEVAQMIDISAVRTHHTLQDIARTVEIAKKYRFVNVHSLPTWTADVRRLLLDEPDIRVGAPVGFPCGGHTSKVKIAEARRLLIDGVQEMDIVMNVGRFKSGEYNYVLDELRQIIALARPNVLNKVIIELNCLDDNEIEKACELTILSGADYLKTGTGWVPGNANLERIARIKQYTQDRIKVKAAGGIRTREDFDRLIDLGVERMGINTEAALEIVESFPKA